MTDGIRDALGMDRNSNVNFEGGKTDLGREIYDLKMQNANEVRARTSAERQSQRYKEALESLAYGSGTLESFIEMAREALEQDDD